MKKLMSKIKSVAVAALTMGLALGAQAATETVSYLEPVIGSNGAVSGYTTKTATCTVLGNLYEDDLTLNSGWYVAAVGGTECENSLIVNGNVRIILRNGKTLKVNTDEKKHGGLRVEEGNSLTIYGQSQDENTMGQLIAYGGHYAAAIGSGSKDGITTGAITINGGKVTATAVDGDGAGIGGGKKGLGSNITINGGVVTATGSANGAGIGGGESANCDGITINGGKVTATGGTDGAGIGGGDDGNGSGIVINGGTVIATGNKGAAGIGGGDNGAGSNITINGGNVTANGSEHGAGIGGGPAADCSYITINGGTVTATGSDRAAGIGGGYGGEASDITINGGTVTATGGYLAAGIGGGNAGSGSGIVINGGNVTAKAGEAAAGIGGGRLGEASDITITGGKVLAYSSYYGAGIGSGFNDGNEGSFWCRNIVITGGRVTAIGGEKAAGIGGGRASSCENVRISGGTIVAKSWSENGMGIGAGCYYYNDEIFEYTWTVRITGGSVNASRIGCTPKNGSGAVVYKTTLTNVDGSPAKITGLSNYGVNDLYPDNGTLYFYLPDGDYTFYSATRVFSGKAGETIAGNAYHGVSVSGTDIAKGSGTGWTFDKESNVLKLSSGIRYELSGADVTGLLQVQVTASSADVTLNNLTLPLTKQNGRPIQFTGGTTNSLILKGVNTVYGQGTYSAVLVGSGAKVTVSGTGELVGNHANSRGFQTEGGTLVMESGTIRDYAVENGGGGVYCRGTFTMNGGTISGCSTSSNGGAICNEGTVTINGGTISGCSAYCGGALFNDGTANIYGGTFTGNSAANFGGFCYCNQGHDVSIYGGYFANNTAPDGRCNLYVAYDYEQNGRLYGGVFAADPLSDAESRGCLGLQSIEQGDVAVTTVGNFYVVGTGVQSQNGQLTAGAYTFNPGNLEYENAGLTVLPGCKVTEQSTTPRTFVVTPLDADFRVNNVRVMDGPGEGWSFDAGTGVLTLSKAMDYTLSGYCNESYAVDVMANATVEFSNVRIHAGALGRSVFNITGSDVTLTLGGSNEVYTTDGNAAFGIASGAKLTLNAGDGVLWGGKSAGANSRCVSVATGGAFTMNGGEIRGYSATTDGSVVLSAGEATINGGTIADNGGTALLSGAVAVYGGVFTGNSSTTLTSGAGLLYGGLYDAEPAATAIVSGSAATKVGDLYVVGQGVTEVDGQLTGGTYTFNPQATEYAAAGLTCAAHYTAVPQGTTPETYTVHAEAEFQVNGVSVETGSGEGWSFVTEGTAGRLTLSKPMDYTLTGYADLTLTVDVLSNATVSLSGIRIKADKPARDIFRVFGDDTTFVLSGTNTVYANDGNAAIGVTAGSRLEVRGQRSDSGIDCLVGGRTSGVNGRCFNVNGELVLEGGTIRDYYAGHGGGVLCYGGTFTMNGGEIAGCSSYLTGSGTSIFGGGIYFQNNATGNLNGGTISGCSAMYGSAFASMWATVNVRSGFVVSNNVATGHGTCFAQRAKINIWGGTYRNNRSNSGVFVSSWHSSTVNVYGGVATDNSGLLFKKNETSVLNVHGGVYSSEPGSEWIVSGSKAEQVGDLWVVGTGVQSDAGKLSYGTYTFDPQEDEYVAVGLGIAECHIVTAQGTTPETYFVDWNYTGLKIGYQDSYGNIVDVKDVIVGSGNGWSFDEATGLVTLTAARDDEEPYVIMGQNTRKDIDLGVSVTANGACVMFTNATITTTSKAAFAVNAANVTLLMAGESTLTAKCGNSAILCPADASVTLQLADGYAAVDSAKLTVSSIDGAGSVSLGGDNGYSDKCGTIEVTDDIIVGTLAIESGILTVAGDVTGDTIAINGGRTTVAGDITGAAVTIDEGGTVVADTIEATGEDASVTINGGSVKAGKVTNPKNGDGDTVWCVTFQGVTEDQVTEWYLGGYDYGTDDIYPIGGELYAWMPSSEDTYEYMYVNDHIEDYEYYYADVHDAPTIAYHKYEEIELYVNGEQVTVQGGTGWTYAQPDDPYPYDWVLTLTADGTNAYVITGEEMAGRVRIVVAGSCDVTFSGRLGGGNLDDYKADNLLVIGDGAKECTVNLTLASTAFFKPYDGYAPIAVQDGATLNLVDAGAMSDLKIDFPGEGTGKVVTADPTTLTFTSEESAKAAAAKVTPVANTEDFPSISTPDAQAAYAKRVTAVAVETSPGTWTLEYQISEQGTNDIVMVISSVETASNLVENITLGTPTATIMPVPGFYYGLPGAVEVEDVEGATPPTWYAGQEDEPLEVKGSTFINADKAFYQLRATLKP